MNTALASIATLPGLSSAYLLMPMCSPMAVTKTKWHTIAPWALEWFR